MTPRYIPKRGAWGGAALTTRIPIFRSVSIPRGQASRQPPSVPLPQNVPPQPAERLWFRAAIAIVESLDAWEGLIELPSFMAAEAEAGQLVPPTYRLVPFALSRFPDDPYLRLDQAVIEERYKTQL